MVNAAKLTEIVLNFPKMQKEVVIVLIFNLIDQTFALKSEHLQGCQQPNCRGEK